MPFSSSVYSNVLPRPSNPEAERRFANVYAAPLIEKSYWRFAACGLIVSNLALIAIIFYQETRQNERIVVREDEIGRAQAIGFTSQGNIPSEASIKYFLTRFVINYYESRSSSILEARGQAMMFLNAPLAAALIAEEKRTKEVEHVTLNTFDEIQVQVDKIVLTNVAKSPYSAQVDIQKIFVQSGTEQRREKYTVSVAFLFAQKIQNDAITVNPLGFTVTALRADQNFR